MVINDRTWPNVYCRQCKGIRAVRVDVTEDARNGRAALDIICAECDFIVATLFRTKRGRRSSLGTRTSELGNGPADSGPAPLRHVRRPRPPRTVRKAQSR